VVLQKPLAARPSPGEGQGEQVQVWRIERRGERERERANEMSAGCDVIMWRRPAMAVLVLACGTLIYYHCAVRNRNIVALISDVLFVISWSLALLGLIFRFLNLTILPVDPSGWQVSVESANYVAAMLANTLGATEGVLRIAAVGSDFKLFLKVKL
jgi:hypothetical protein